MPHERGREKRAQNGNRENQSAKRSDASDWCWLELKWFTRKKTPNKQIIWAATAAKSNAAKNKLAHHNKLNPSQHQIIWKHLKLFLRLSHKSFNFIFCSQAETDETETLTQNHRIPQNVRCHPIEMHSRSMRFDCSALIKIENDIKITKDSMTSDSPHLCSHSSFLFFSPIRLSITLRIIINSTFVVDAVILFTSIWSSATTTKWQWQRNSRWTMLISWMRADGSFCKFRRFYLLTFIFVFIALASRKFGNGFVAFVVVVIAF